MHPDLEGKGIVIHGMVHVSPREAFDLVLKGAVLVDIREDFETEMGVFDVEHLIWCPNSAIAENFAALPTGRLLIIADCVGLRSKEVAKILMDKGFSHVANLNGGIADWERDGLPMKSDKDLRLHGPCPCQLRPLKKVTKSQSHRVTETQKDNIEPI